MYPNLRPRTHLDLYCHGSPNWNCQFRASGGCHWRPRWEGGPLTLLGCYLEGDVRLEVVPLCFAILDKYQLDSTPLNLSENLLLAYVTTSSVI